MSNIQILTLIPKKIEFLFRNKFKHASRAKNSSYNIMQANRFFNIILTKTQSIMDPI